MSRNKMIKFVHETTGLSYGECRRRLKECNWDVWKASGMESVLDTFLESMKPLREAFTALANSMLEVIGSIDWSAIAEAIIKAKEEEHGQDSADDMCDGGIRSRDTVPMDREEREQQEEIGCHNCRRRYWCTRMINFRSETCIDYIREWM